MKAILALMFLSSCVLLQAPEEAAALSPSKQRQKVVVLEKKLKRAEKEEKSAKEEVDRLKLAMREAQLSLIRKQVEDCQEKIRRNVPLDLKEPVQLFLREREMLHQIVLDGPSVTAFEAQRVLDQILEIITGLSDDNF